MNENRPKNPIEKSGISMVYTPEAMRQKILTLNDQNKKLLDDHVLNTLGIDIDVAVNIAETLPSEEDKKELSRLLVDLRMLVRTEETEQTLKNLHSFFEKHK